MRAKNSVGEMPAKSLVFLYNMGEKFIFSEGHEWRAEREQEAVHPGGIHSWRQSKIFHFQGKQAEMKKSSILLQPDEQN